MPIQTPIGGSRTDILKINVLHLRFRDGLSRRGSWQRLMDLTREAADFPMVYERPQVRELLNLYDLEDLSASIVTHGIIQPIRVKYEDELDIATAEVKPRAHVDNGHRRTFAGLMAVHRRLIPILMVPAVLVDAKMTEPQRLIQDMISDTQMPLTDLERAEGVKQLILWGMNLDDIAKQFGRSRTTIENWVKLANAGAQVKEALQEGEITYSEALAVAKTAPGRIDKQGEKLEEIKSKKAEHRAAGGNGKLGKKTSTAEQVKKTWRVQLEAKSPEFYLVKNAVSKEQALVMVRKSLNITVDAAMGAFHCEPLKFEGNVAEVVI